MVIDYRGFGDSEAYPRDGYVFKLPMTSLQAVLPSSESIKIDRIDKADCHTGMSLVTVDCPTLSVH